MKNRFPLSSVIIFGILLLVIACTHEPMDTVPTGNNVNPPVDTVACDSTNVTYTSVVQPILNSYCISCHSGAAPSGGLDFTNYNQVAFVAQSGQLLGSIKHMQGYQPMPQNGPKLSDCEIALIEKWISDTTFNSGGSNGIPCDPDTIYFQNDVLPLIQSSCGVIGCHDEGTAQDDVILTSFLHIIQTGEVVPFQPLESKIYEKIIDNDPDDRMPPPPAAPLTADQKNIIYTWIAQGALNNHCDQMECDSTNVSFSENVFPIIQNHCYGCHSGPNPNGGIVLTNYQQIKSAASVSPGTPGSLLGAITHYPGNSPMPQNGMPLSDCQIAQIRNWIEEGILDN